MSSLDSIDVIKSKYRKLCKKYHPDIIGSGSTEKFMEVQKAWEFIEANKQERKRQYWSHKSLFNIIKRSF